MATRPSYELIIIQGPTTHPITLGEARNQLGQVQELPDDAFVESLIATAHRYIAKGFNLTPMTTQYKLVTGRLVKVLPHPPIQSIESIKYYDSSNELVELSPDDYTLYAGSSKIHYTNPNLVISTSSRSDRFVIDFTAGYPNAAAVPATIKHAMKLLVAHYYAQREATNVEVPKEIELGVKSLLRGEKSHYWRA